MMMMMMCLYSGSVFTVLLFWLVNTRAHSKLNSQKTKQYKTQQQLENRKKKKKKEEEDNKNTRRIHHLLLLFLLLRLVSVGALVYVGRRRRRRRRRIKTLNSPLLRSSRRPKYLVWKRKERNVNIRQHNPFFLSFPFLLLLCLHIDESGIKKSCSWRRPVCFSTVPSRLNYLIVNYGDGDGIIYCSCCDRGCPITAAAAVVVRLCCCGPLFFPLITSK